MIKEEFFCYENNVYEKFKAFEQGLYFIGLDNHVGFLYLKNEQKYFIHSNYIEGVVMIEYAENSVAFVSENYYFSKISANKSLALKWLMNEEVLIIRK